MMSRCPIAQSVDHHYRMSVVSILLFLCYQLEIPPIPLFFVFAKQTFLVLVVETPFIPHSSFDSDIPWTRDYHAYTFP